MALSVYNTSRNLTSQRAGGSLLRTLGIFIALSIMTSVMFIAATPLQNLQARKISEAAYSESDTPTPQDIIPGSQKQVGLPYGTCCQHAYGIYTIALHPDDIRLKDPTILMPKVFENAAVFIGGEWVAGRGQMTKPSSRFKRWPHLYRLPREKVRAGISLEIVVTREIGEKLLDPFFIGEYGNLKLTHNTINLTRAYLPTFHIVVSLFTAMLCIMGAFLFHARSVLYSLAIFMVFGAGTTAVEVLPLSWIPGQVNHALFMVFFLGTLASSLCFILEWTSVFAATGHRKIWLGMDRPIPVKIKRRIWQITWAFFLLVSAISIYLTFAQGVPGAMLANKAALWTAFILLPILCIRLFAYYLNSGKEAIIEIFVFTLVVLSAFFDVVMMQFFGRGSALVSTANLFLPFAFLWSLVRRAQSGFDAVMVNNTQLNKAVQTAERKILVGQKDLRRHEMQAALLKERTRIMRDMHDGVGGQLVSLLSSVRGGKSNVTEMEQDIQSALNDLRLMIDSLDNVGTSLDTALAIFQERARTRLVANGIKLSWKNLLDEPAEGFGSEAVLHIYRILQEALTNIQRHAQAKNVSITVEKIAGELPLRITVKDDGRGISSQKRNGRGIESMKRRAHKLGGTLTIESKNSGTTLSLHLKETPMSL